MTLYENAIKLKGFLGKDAENRTTAGNNTFTVLSLATKSSYKDKHTGDWVSRSEWHRIVCFAKPAEYASGLKKGDYVAIEGELRSSEYDAKVDGGKKAQTKRRSWEIRANLVRKLDRPAKQEESFDSAPVTDEDAA